MYIVSMKKMDRYVDYVVKELYDLTKIDYDNQKILIYLIQRKQLY